MYQTNIEQQHVSQVPSVPLSKLGVNRKIIGKLVHKKMTESKGKGGWYAGKLFTARYRG